MHDIDHTLSLAELENSFEQPDRVLDEDQVEQLAQQLIEANDEFELEEAMDAVYISTIPNSELEFESAGSNPAWNKLKDFARSGAWAGPTAGLAANQLTKAGADFAKKKGWIEEGTKDFLKTWVAPALGWGTAALTGYGVGKLKQRPTEDQQTTEEELEFEGASNLVRTLSDAARTAARHKNDAPPATVAKKAFVSAVKKHAPHLLKASQGKAKSGRWTRRGNQIILHGI
jgi:hypothetical protein